MVDSKYPYVSVIIPTYNRKVLLNNAISSLLNQSYPKDKYEIIICDSSTDDTHSMVENFIKKSECSIRYIWNEKKGPAFARNMGLRIAVGEIIAFTDDDCEADLNWIISAVKCFKSKSVAGIQGSTVPLQITKISPFKPAHTINILNETWNYPTCNMFYRKDVLLEVGGFDSNFIRGEDTDLAWRIKRKYNISFCKHSVVKHIVEYQSISSTFKSFSLFEYDSMLYKKIPDIRKNFVFGIIWHKNLVYVSFLIFSLFLFILQRTIFPNFIHLPEIFLLFGIASYFYSRVFIRKGSAIKYFLRTIAIFYFLPFDLVSLYYVMKGNMRYKCFII